MGFWSNITFNQDGQCYYNQMGHPTYLLTYYNLPTYYLPTYYNLPTFVFTYLLQPIRLPI
jgi:hypothetical protein